MNARTLALGLCALLVVAVALVVVVLGGLAAAAYFVVVVLATSPGWPLGFRLFGPRHPAGWVSGMLLGYALAALAFWAVEFTGHASTAAFVVGWIVANGVTWTACRRGWRERGALTSLPRWTTQDTIALALVLLLVPALMGPTLGRIGARDASGNRLYHAYFTADFVWHEAVVAEMSKHVLPPRNPFLASQPMHYYWTYFLVPATAGPMVGADPQLSLEVTAVIVAALFLAMLHLAALTALPGRPFTTAAALLLTVVASSAEGIAAIVFVLHAGQGLGALRNLNVDALARGFGGLRIDDLPREMWYTPHHSTACALGLIALPIATLAGVRARWSAIFLAGVALAASVMFNPLVGAVFCAVYGLIVLVDARRTRASLMDVLHHTAAVSPVVLALAWIGVNQIAAGTSGAFRFGWIDPPFSGAVPSFLLSFGPLLLVLALGLWPQREVPFWNVAPAAFGILISVVIMHFVLMTVDEFWVGFRTGELVFVLAPALAGRGLVLLQRAPKSMALSGVATVFLLGVPTTAIDVFDAQDVENQAMGPGFHWTVRLTPDEQEGLQWIREHTPPDAIVQADPTVRGRETWSLIPTWAGRRMAAGQPIGLMHIPDYDITSAAVREIYESPDPMLAWHRAKDLNINFLYVDRTERSAYPAVAKFDAVADQFLPVFRNAEVTVYAVR